VRCQRRHRARDCRRGERGELECCEVLGDGSSHLGDAAKIIHRGLDRNSERSEDVDPAPGSILDPGARGAARARCTNEDLSDHGYALTHQARRVRLHVVDSVDGFADTRERARPSGRQRYPALARDTGYRDVVARALRKPSVGREHHGALVLLDLGALNDEGRRSRLWREAVVRGARRQHQVDAIGEGDCEVRGPELEDALDLKCRRVGRSRKNREPECEQQARSTLTHPGRSESSVEHHLTRPSAHRPRRESNLMTHMTGGPQLMRSNRGYDDASAVPDDVLGDDRIEPRRKRMGRYWINGGRRRSPPASVSRTRQEVDVSAAPTVRSAAGFVSPGLRRHRCVRSARAGVVSRPRPYVPGDLELYTH